MIPQRDRARRCTICGISWPAEYGKCYVCGGGVDLFQGTPTISEEEAASLKKHWEFDRYLEKTGRA